MAKKNLDRGYDDQNTAYYNLLLRLLEAFYSLIRIYKSRFINKCIEYTI